jgi:hypothetical protein
MQLKKTIFIVLVGLLLSACATKEYKKQESVFIVFKTSTFKHADLGFIYQNDNELKVEIYSSGQAIMSLEISDSLVCMGALKCMSKSAFNQRVLSEHYPESILDNIFKGQKILESKNLVNTRNGFTQNIMKANKYNIKYSVLNKQIVFRDTINDILIKVKRL